jgi:hypothetical protein
MPKPLKIDQVQIEKLSEEFHSEKAKAEELIIDVLKSIDSQTSELKAILQKFINNAK